MMESPHFPAASSSAENQSALRMPEWAELAARFGAARDLRTALHKGNSISGGSFNRFASGDQQSVNAGAAPVNLTGLEHGKADAGMIAETQDNGLLQADRETR